jgi:DNA-binding winged helix-turn-helix (wHTH) protein
MEKARLHGDWDDLLKVSEERLAAALQKGRTERIAESARAVAWAAWYRNDDDRVAAVQQIVKDCGETLLASTQSAVSIAEWDAALTARDTERARDLFDYAIDAADGLENNFFRITLRISAALLLPSQRHRVREARAIAQRIESPPLQASIELLIDSAEPCDYGIFKTFAARAAQSPLKAGKDMIFVDVIRGRVRRGSEIVHVSDRGLELLAALALFETGTSNEELAAALWPALDRKAAVNSLKMCVSRTRAQIGDRDSIENTRNGYSLGEHVVSDIRELERLVQDVRGAGTLGETMRRQVQELLNGCGARQPALATDWAWFPRYAARLDEFYRELTQALAKNASRREHAGIAG